MVIALMKRAEQFVQNLFNHCLKIRNSLFHPLKSICSIHIKVSEGKSGHLNINAYLLYEHSLYFE